MVTSGPRRNLKRIAELEGRVDGLERQMQSTGDQIAQMPNRDMMHRLDLSLARMEGHIDRLDERLKPVAAIADRMQELMLQEAKARK
ncbi:hypothetical protein DDZ14_16185 [Maritimibacter sp. 55A14]|nr:hypothetical protein DDZ14_16185 [Maritimibacter sp. 55A14]